MLSGGGSIFDEARKMSQSKKSTNPLDRTTQRSESTSTPARSTPKVPSSTPLSEEVKSMIERMKNLHDEIDHQLDEAFQRSGWSSSDIKRFLDNPNNFDSSEWERIQSERHALLSTIWDRLKGDNGGGGSPAQLSGPTPTPKDRDPASTARKNRMMGAHRNRNWIPVR